MELSPEQEAAFNAAARRASYRLTFAHAAESRGFKPDSLPGPEIPDAYREGGMQNGDWQQMPSFAMNDRCLEGVDEAQWLAHFLSMTVNEAVHEALEHFRVDGKPFLDPHGPAEEEIYLLVNELAANLAALTEGEQ